MESSADNMLSILILKMNKEYQRTKGAGNESKEGQIGNSTVIKQHDKINKK